MLCAPRAEAVSFAMDGAEEDAMSKEAATAQVAGLPADTPPWFRGRGPLTVSPALSRARSRRSKPRTRIERRGDK